ncbi:G_PROTEIN_RECEP_F3_4 domain-containing protein [Meloidogyne graminicola]|uniref:G_PROTEIN_RECEP_F3_4 domain-containing protein n=1 Tax=Meloidogyne graminicola TaxID=189291 RepID=A0A8S9ZV30_9BILA|nr:G_PROTEIN_RECEP_F3_4 domain-containing protein [Meloidogyne graminicola]
MLIQTNVLFIFNSIFQFILLSLISAIPRQVVIPGSVLLGGLFPIHESSRNASGSSLCGRIKADQGVQRMVSMLYAIEQINKNYRILPGIPLGAQILDSCSVETHALEQSLQFIQSVCNEGEQQLQFEEKFSSFPQFDMEQNKMFKTRKITAVIANFILFFKIPMISYSSTGVELSEKPRFAYFSRVVPPDNLQARAMAHLVSALGWNYVHAIVDTGSYGERGMDSFRAAAAELNICIDGDVHKISRRWTDEQYEELLLRMRNSKARGVVMFVDEDNLRRFLSNLKRLIYAEKIKPYRPKRFVASDSWGVKLSVVKGFEHIINGAITVAPKVRYLQGFAEYFASLGPSNTFLSEYWQSMNCSEHFHPNFGSCFKTQGHSFKQEAYVPFVYDAVQLVARALHNYIKEDCGFIRQWEECSLAKNGFDGKRLQKLYRNVSLIDGQPPLIDANGDGNGQYSIFQLDERGLYRRVGGWIDHELIDLDVADIRAGLQENTNYIPLSVCSLPCSEGHYKAYQDQSCCWTCIPCDTTTSIMPNKTSCIQCPLGQVPNAELSICQQIKPIHLDWDSPWAFVPAIFSIIGLIATGAVSAIFIRYNYTPVIMASGRELCYCMLAGIALCYGVTFVLVSPPSELVCTLTRILIGLSMAIVYAAILVKTNRLTRVFKPNSALRPRWIGPTTQVFFCAILASVQLGIALIWIWLEPPGTAIQYPSRTEAVLTCKTTLSHLLISLFYCGILIIACTIYAFKTREIPENFNETRLIGFTMYSTSILWLAFGPIYFATQNNVRIQLTSLCITISLSGTVALTCFFVPKVYICLFQPYKNVRTRSSAVGKLVNQQMRFIRYFLKIIFCFIFCVFSFLLTNILFFKN